MLSGNFYGSKIRRGIFWGLNFGPGLFGFCLKRKEFFWVFVFAPIRSTLSLEIQSPPSPRLLDIKSQPNASIRALTFKMAANLSTKCRRNWLVLLVATVPVVSNCHALPIALHSERLRLLTVGSQFPVPWRVSQLSRIFASSSLR